MPGLISMDADVFGLLMVALVLAAEVVSAQAQAAIQWEEPTKEVLQGETFSMTCSLSNMKMMDIVRLVKENEGETDNQISISDRDIVKSPFLETNRYSVSVNRRAKTVTLSFAGVRGEDSGRIGCHKLEENPEIAWVDLKVLVPIKDIYISERDESGHESRLVHKDAMVHLRENHEGGALCRAVVSGSLTSPTLRVFVDGEDKTALFHAEPKSETLPNGGLPTYSSEMQLVYDKLKPDASFNGKSFVCEGEMEGFDKMTAEAIFNVEYIPIVTCTKYEHYALLGSSMALGCDVQSNPPATVSWLWGDDKHITSGQADEANHLTAEEKPLETSDKKQVILEISEVMKDHFGTYTLTATNEYGEKSVMLQLRKASTAPKPEVKQSEGERNEKQGSVGTVQAMTTPEITVTEAPETTSTTIRVTPDPQSVTGGGVAMEYRLWNLLMSLPLSIFILITVT